MAGEDLLPHTTVCSQSSGYRIPELKRCIYQASSATASLQSSVEKPASVSRHHVDQSDALAHHVHDHDDDGNITCNSSDAACSQVMLTTLHYSLTYTLHWHTHSHIVPWAGETQWSVLYTLHWHTLTHRTLSRWIIPSAGETQWSVLQCCQLSLAHHDCLTPVSAQQVYTPHSISYEFNCAGPY